MQRTCSLDVNDEYSSCTSVIVQGQVLVPFCCDIRDVTYTCEYVTLMPVPLLISSTHLVHYTGTYEVVRFLSEVSYVPGTWYR